MAPPAHVRITFSGIFGDFALPSEIWSFGLSATRGTGGFWTVAGCAQVALALRTVYDNRIKQITRTSARCTRIRVAAVGDDGHVERDSNGQYVQADNMGNSPGTATGEVRPPQVALAIGTRTTTAGPVGRGRFFLPAPGVDLASDLRLTTVSQTSVGASVKSFVNDVNGTLTATLQGDAPRVCVASGGSLVKGIPPALYPVTGVEVGRVFDTQRRRRNAMLEEPVLVPLV